MGYSVAGEGRKDVDTLIASLQSAFAEVSGKAN